MIQQLYNGVQLVGRPDLANIARLDHGIVPMVNEMMGNGVAVDTARLNALTNRLGWEMLGIELDIYDAVGHDNFSIASPDQLERVLFNSRSRGGLDLDPGPIRLTPTGKRFKVDDDALAFLEPQHACIAPIRQWREREKICNTYSTKLPKLLGLDGRIHTSLNITIVVTGRLSSSSPNLQNIPIRSALGREVRCCFIPSPGNCLGAIDLSQIELVIAAHYSKAVRLLDALNHGQDIHAISAGEFFNWTRAERECSKSAMSPNQIDERRKAKTGNFSAIYEIMPGGLSTRMIGEGCDPDEWDAIRCADFLGMFYDLYPELTDYQNEQHRRARRYGFVWTLFGRVRFIPEVRSKVDKIVEEGCRYASNMPIQGTAGDILKLNMMEATPIVRDYQSMYPGERFACAPLLQVHDELLFEGKREVLEQLLPELAEMITRSVRLDAPVKAGWGISETNWGDLER